EVSVAFGGRPTAVRRSRPAGRPGRDARVMGAVVGNLFPEGRKSGFPETGFSPFWRVASRGPEKFCKARASRGRAPRRASQGATMAQTLSFNGRRRVRKFFGNIPEVAEMPNLIEVQKASYDQFLMVKE